MVARVQAFKLCITLPRSSEHDSGRNGHSTAVEAYLAGLRPVGSVPRLSQVHRLEPRVAEDTMTR